MDVKRKYGEEYIPPEIIKELMAGQKITPHFPKPGIGYVDMFSLTSNPVYAPKVRGAISTLFDPNTYDVIVAIGTRGYILGGILMGLTGKPLVPVPKAGKSPGWTVQIEYALEYNASETIEIQCDLLSQDMKVLVVDDLIATGGTIGATLEMLTERFYCKPVGVAVLNSLEYIPRKVELPEKCPLRAVLHYTEAPALPEYDPQVHCHHIEVCRPYAMNLD